TYCHCRGAVWIRMHGQESVPTGGLNSALGQGDMSLPTFCHLRTGKSLLTPCVSWSHRENTKTPLFSSNHKEQSSFLTSFRRHHLQAEPRSRNSSKFNRLRKWAGQGNLS